MRPRRRGAAVRDRAPAPTPTTWVPRARSTSATTRSARVAQLADTDESFLRRLVTGTGTHSGRRLHEMEAAVEMLADLGVDPVMTRAPVASLRQIAGDPDSLPALPASPA